ncbi:FAD/NAD(P)-binding domain-containing protein [Myriangium duriaei CBS 260.36]|uniref:Kynurenine 3-monooxygenase n=1 Tax=Myriangium duriaei CBS 260.36 TaxID=1168546 RepID=A0A9P4IVS3_9PEZI|nr:FAD/NAD(P)-binding domain-containing protein [Myriangium duriaei CBS 260.36]
MSKDKIVVVGAGPVGALAAIYAAERGHEVEVYELRSDLRDESTVPLNFTKSINLALSERGINAMRHANRPALLESVLDETIPMHGRMIHGERGGELFEESQQYDIHGRFIRAADRGMLNKRLLDELESLPNVKLFFNHKLTGADFKRNQAWFEARDPASTSRAPEIQVPFDLMLGCDGAHSAVRYHMMKYTRTDYTQSYIDTLWCEFHMPPTSDNTFAISPNHLHIWPAHEFMFIAIPSSDRSFTCTLFMPSSHFTTLDATPSSLIPFFNTHFPGIADRLIPSSSLTSQYATNPHLPLISITASPHHALSSVAILGDAANAMVPFYGQGMNAGLESVRLLFSTLDSHPSSDRAEALAAYSAMRVPQAKAICELAMNNYQEMRSDVRSPVYRLRKSIEEKLSVWFPRLGWATQYSRVSFENVPYDEVVRRARRQGQVLGWWLAGLVGAGGMGAAWVGVGIGLRWWRSRR